MIYNKIIKEYTFENEKTRGTFVTFIFSGSLKLFVARTDFEREIFDT